MCTSLLIHISSAAIVNTHVYAYCAELLFKRIDDVCELSLPLYSGTAQITFVRD